MLILTLLALVAIPVAIDLALRGRHQTIELSMARSAAMASLGRLRCINARGMMPSFSVSGLCFARARAAQNMS